MNEIRMDKAKLRGILQANRDRHRELFEEAHDAFRKKAIENLESRLDAVREGKRIELHLGLVEPEDHTEDYDRALEMLDLEVREQVTLSQGEFRTLVQDDWGWKLAFATSYTENTGKFAG